MNLLGVFALVIVLYILYYFIIPIAGVSILLYKGSRAHCWKELHIKNGKITAICEQNGRDVTIERSYEVTPLRFMVSGIKTSLEDLILDILD